MGLFGNKKILVTHNGKFHADDIFACATIQLVLDQLGKKYKVVRTRDEKKISEGDYVFDIGGAYDTKQHRYDHHQKGGAGQRANGIPYAAFGLVWKRFGRELCDSQEIADIIERRLVQPVDANDNGIELYSNTNADLSPYTLQDILYIFRPTWKEGFVDREYNKQFEGQVAFAKELLQREIRVIRDNREVLPMIKEAYQKVEDKRIIQLEDSYPWEMFMDEFPDVLFVIYPRLDQWRVGTVPSEKGTFSYRKKLPLSWAGTRQEETARATGVDDAVFCHNGRFLAVAKSKEGAWKLSKLALEHNESPARTI
jgi:uncharacterized UPF0160 family protein